MKASEVQLYPYKEHPEIIKDLFGYRFQKPIDTLFPLFDYISEPILEIGFWKVKYCIIQKGNLFGVIKEDGSIIVPPVYIQVIPTDGDKFFLLSTDFKWGLMGICHDSEKYLLKDMFFIPCLYDEIGAFSEGYYVVMLDGKYGYAPLVKDGLNILPQYEDAKPFQEGLAAVMQSGKWGFIDKFSNHITSFEYEDVDNFHDGVANVQKNGVKYQIGYDGKCISEDDHTIIPNYDHIGVSHEGLRAVVQYYNLGFVDIHGNIKIPLTYKCSLTASDESRFLEGFACVKKGDYWGYIDKQNRVVFPFILDFNKPLKNGYAIVSDGDMNYKIVTIKHFSDYMQGKRIPFFTYRPPRERSSDMEDGRWSREDLEDAYMAALEDDISNEWNFD